jgi:hypothetical protein
VREPILRRLARSGLPFTITLVVLIAGLAAVGAFLIIDRTSTDDPDGIEVSSGEIPETMPAGFPIPGDAVIGRTSVDRTRNTTIVNLITPGGMVSAVSTYTIGLVSAGYVVERSSEHGDGWEIRFGRLDLRGTIALSEGAGGIEAVVTIVDP